MSAQQARGGLDTIEIRGNKYVTVAERIKAVTDIEDLDKNRYEIEEWERFELDGRNFVTCHIIVGTSFENAPLPDGPERVEPKRYSGTAQISFTGGMVNTTSGYENAETSALGRALAFAGIGLLEGVASADEINKARAAQAAPKQLGETNSGVPTGEAYTPPAKPAEPTITEQEAAELMALAKGKGYTTRESAAEFLNAICLQDFTALKKSELTEIRKAILLHHKDQA